MSWRDDVLAVMQHKEVHPIPFTLGIDGGIAEKMDEHYGTSDWRKKLVPYIAGVGGVPYIPFTEAIDENHSYDAYGGIWRNDLNIPHHTQVALSEPDLDGLNMPEPSKILPPETIDKMKDTCQQRRDSFTNIGLGGGVWEICWHIRGFENALMDTALNPEFFRELVQLAADQIIAYIELARDVPADGMMLGDDWGGQQGVLLGGELWREYMKPQWARIIGAIHDTGKYAINHSCGSVAEIMPDIVEIDLDILENLQPETAGMDPYELKRKYGNKITLWGGLGSQSIIPFGTPEGLRTEIRKLCTEMGRGGGYILSTTKGVMHDTPPENAIAVYEAFIEQ
ncbi:uroporphyrinogen decarboxylase family protein [Candidatus Poribacteria bacterium]